MKLTSLKIKSLPLGKLFCDGGGLYIRLNSPNSGNWAFKYMRNGKSHEMGLGPYPEISLRDARTKRDKIKVQLADGKDPLSEKRKIQRDYATKDRIRFSWVAERTIENQRLNWTCPKQEKI